jgi:N-acetylmuramic acid 6-phosphate etherase
MNLHSLSVGDLVALIGAEDRAVWEALQRVRPALTALIEAVEAGFQEGGRLVYLGAGTSGRLGVLDASEAPPTFQVGPDRIIGIIAGGDAALRRSSESREDDPRGAYEELEKLNLGAADCILGIAAGGTTPFVLGGLEFAKGLSPPPITGLLVCAPIPKPPAIDHLLVADTGPEVLTGSTRMKAGTATKLVLNTISTTLMVRSGRVFENLMVDLKATNDKLTDRAARIVSEITGLGRSDALALLDSAGGSVKTAIVCHVHNMNVPDAERLLEVCDGRLNLAFEARRP